MVALLLNSNQSNT